MSILNTRVDGEIFHFRADYVKMKCEEKGITPDSGHGSGGASGPGGKNKFNAFQIMVRPCLFSVRLRHLVNLYLRERKVEPTPIHVPNM